MAVAMVYLRLNQGKYVKVERLSSTQQKDKLHIGFIKYILQSAFDSLCIAFNNQLQGFY